MPNAIKLYGLISDRLSQKKGSLCFTRDTRTHEVIITVPFGQYRVIGRGKDLDEAIEKAVDYYA